jgi:hypothetical protein
MFYLICSNSFVSTRNEHQIKRRMQNRKEIISVSMEVHLSTVVFKCLVYWDHVLHYITDPAQQGADTYNFYQSC